MTTPLPSSTPSGAGDTANTATVGASPAQPLTVSAVDVWEVRRRSPYATDHPTRLAALWAARDAAYALGPRVKFIGARGLQSVLMGALGRGEDMNAALHAFAANYDAIVVGIPTGYVIHSCAGGFGPVVRYARIPAPVGALPQKVRP